MLNRHSWPWQQRSKIGLVPPHPRVPQGKSKSNRRPFQNKVVQDVAKKGRTKRIEPTGKISGSPKPVVPIKSTFLAGSPTFCFSFYYNCVDMIKQPPGITCCLLLVRKKKKLKNWCEQKKINEIVVKFEASSVISLIPPSHVTTTPFFKKSNCRNVPPPTPPFLIFFSAFVSCSRHLIWFQEKKKTIIIAINCCARE